MKYIKKFESMDMENLKEVKPNRFLYHTSNPIFRDKISKEGLIPKGKSDGWLSNTKIDGEVIFAVNSDNKKDWWDSTYDDDIYRIDTTNLNNKWYCDPNFDIENHRVITFEKIPSDSIRLIYNGSGKTNEDKGYEEISELIENQKSLIPFSTNESDNISALSYLKVNNNVPKNELLFKFVDTYSDNKYTDYFNKIINLKLQRTPVYVIKKIGNIYEYEVYFYRYDPYRKSKYLIIILDDYETFTKKQEFDKLDVKPYNNKLFKENEFIIVSYDINENFFNNTELTYNYYYENEDKNDLFRYLIKEEDPQGNIVTTNKYGLFKILFKTEDKKKYLVDLFETDDCIIFYAYKPKTNTYALYYEKSTFDKFIFFLEYFKYDNNIIDFCKNKYNNTYDFCFSYDLDDKFNIKKTAIFSIF